MIFVNNICRACNTEKENLIDIFKHKQNEATISLTEMLEYCTGTTVKNELKYPRNICYSCIKQLEICFRFLNRFNLAKHEFEEVDSYMKESTATVNGDANQSDDIVQETEACGEMRQTHLPEIPDNDLPEFVSKVEREEPVVEMSIEYIEPIDESPKFERSSTAVMCSACQKTFLTTKALQLHLKISHKRKITTN